MICTTFPQRVLLIALMFAMESQVYAPCGRFSDISRRAIAAQFHPTINLMPTIAKLLTVNNRFTLIKFLNTFTTLHNDECMRKRDRFFGAKKYSNVGTFLKTQTKRSFPMSRMRQKGWPMSRRNWSSPKRRDRRFRMPNWKDNTGWKRPGTTVR